MNNIGKRLMPIYLIKFLEENYFDIIPENFGRRMVSRQFIAEIKALYDEFDGKPIDNYGRRMVPEYLIKAFSDIEYIEYTDDDVKYEKTVPTGALKYATLDMLGGMSYKSENLLVLEDKQETTTNGITYKVENGIIYVKGTTTTSENVEISLLTNINLSGSFNLFSSLSSASLYYRTGASAYYSSATQQTRTNITLDRFSLIFSGTGGNNSFNQENYITIKPMLVKGSTAPTEFKVGYEGIRDSAVTSVVAKKTYEIDEHIQAVTGYGWGINDNCYNYIDYEAKKFIQKVGKYIVNNDTEITEQLADSGYGIGARIMISNNVLHASSPITNLSLDKITYSNYYSSNGIGYSVHNANDTNAIYIRLGEDYNTVEKVKTYLVNNNATFYYELATPVETDISDYIKDNFIEVEPTGSVTFTNEYEQAVPSEVTYLIKE